jgi:hypothetical protein
MYSDGDLQIDTLGAAYMQFGQGHATVVTTGDATYNVSAGVFTVKAQNGVSITAGAVPTTAETLVGGNTAAGAGAGSAAGLDASAGSDAATQAGASATASSAPADLYLWASNNINQKAFGPMSEVTYGDSYKNVQGNTTDIFSGNYYKETHGELTQHLYADTHNYYHQNTDTLTLGGTAACFLGAAVSFKMDVEVNIIVGAKTDITLGAALKIVGGIDLSLLTYSLKLTIGDSKICVFDSKVVTADTKTMVTDVKTGVIDFKNVTVDAKNFGVEIKNGEMQGTAKDAIVEGTDLHAKLVAMHIIA